MSRSPASGRGWMGCCWRTCCAGIASGRGEAPASRIHKCGRIMSKSAFWPYLNPPNLPFCCGLSSFVLKGMGTKLTVVADKKHCILRRDFPRSKLARSPSRGECADGRGLFET
jgi:hypothetical protein